MRTSLHRWKFLVFFVLVFPFSVKAVSANSDTKGQDQKAKSVDSSEKKITQSAPDEKPFKNKYYAERREGIYVDSVSGEVLFSSLEKYDSGTGWPSFWRPLVSENLVEKEQKSLLSKRTEIRSKVGNNLIGHVFNDGPQPTGRRYCVFSSALRFIPKEEMKKEGYGQFLDVFEKGKEEFKRAVFAGGCFWCLEPPFDEVKGVISTTSGYAGGSTENPTYEEVSKGNTGHREVLEVTYDPKQVTYEQLLEVFWKNVDPFDDKGQFCDKGVQYTSAILVDAKDRAIVEKSKEKWEKKLGKKFSTAILEATTFSPAEEHHQDYYKKNPVRYKFYRYQCGRDNRLKDVWDKAK